MENEILINLYTHFFFSSIDLFHQSEYFFFPQYNSLPVSVVSQQRRFSSLSLILLLKHSVF